MGSVEEVSQLLSQWEEVDNTGGDVTSILNKLAEIFEIETQAFLKQDPDPFDDRHPSRSEPDCTLGHILKSVFRHQRIVDEMIKVYSQRDIVELNTAVCRFLLDLLPGLENVVFQEEAFVLKLFQWSEFASDPLQSYATGLLAAAMENPEIASSYREKNAYFVPLMLKRLYEISKKYLLPKNTNDGSCVAPPVCKETNAEEGVISVSEESKTRKGNRKSSKRCRGITKLARYNPMYSEKREKEKQTTLKSPPVDVCVINESSNSTWTENMLGSYQVYPLTLAAQQRYILQYLTPMGEYQELIGHVFEEGALTLTLRYIDLNQNPDVRLAFEALKYLASLLNHKKIALEFLNIGGLPLVLKVPKSTIAAAGVSFCLYYLGYLEEALEKICMSSSEVISDLVSYGLWLLECSHDSSRCHATLFFGFSFRFKSLLQHFDQQDGLRKLFNVILELGNSGVLTYQEMVKSDLSIPNYLKELNIFCYVYWIFRYSIIQMTPPEMGTLELFVSSEGRSLSDDEIYGDRITTKHVCATLKRYFEAHLAVLVEEKRKRIDGSPNTDARSFQNEMLMCEAVEKNIQVLHDLSLIPLFHWKPVNEFVNLDAVSFLLELIVNYLQTGVSGRADTVKSALDVLKVCSLAASAQLKFCEKTLNRVLQYFTGISVLLQAAEHPSPEIQQSALITIINCVCPKIPNGESGSRSTPKKKACRQEEILYKVWKNVRIKNGIIVLINLLFNKVPVTDADSIRALACRALCGLARSQNVQQIISKLPLVTDGQLTDLMKEPVLQDKYHHHVQFCKYGLELIERVTGAPLTPGSESLDLSKLSNSEVVTKTKIVYNEYQLLQLICDHLKKKGFQQTVQCLQKEMEDKNMGAKQQILCPLPPAANGSVHRPLPWTNVSSSTTSPTILCSVPFIPPPSVPLQIKKKTASQIFRSPRGRLQKPQACSGSYVQSPALIKRQTLSSQPTISLDSIVTEYLRKQHSLCKNPVLACPQFDLFEPHKCPEPQNKKNAPVNCVLRLQKRETSFQNGGYQGAALNTKHIYSRFRLYRTYRDEEDRSDFITCKFFNYQEDTVQKLFVGTEMGKLQVINVESGKQIFSKDCHLRGIAHIDTKETTSMFITSDGSRIGTSAVWKVVEDVDIDVVKSFYDISHLEFGKRGLDRLIGTKHTTAALIDANTFTELQTFSTEDLGNNYGRNRATLDFFDELVLSDGVVFDARSGQMVHKLDKFNSLMNGVFHPNGREIICNSEIWDIRTFKLLRTVAGLDACRVTFNSLGNVIYAVAFKDSVTAGKMNCFYTFDAHNYNIISTVDVKRPVYEIAADRNDRFVCTVEGYNNLEYMCRLYEVGRTKQAGDENGDESEDSSSDEEHVDEEEDTDDGEGQTSEVQFEVDEDDNDDENDLNWLSSTSSDDDNETLFALNTSTIED